MCAQLLHTTEYWLRWSKHGIRSDLVCCR